MNEWKPTDDSNGDGVGVEVSASEGTSRTEECESSSDGAANLLPKCSLLSFDTEAPAAAISVAASTAHLADSKLHEDSVENRSFDTKPRPVATDLDRPAVSMGGGASDGAVEIVPRGSYGDSGWMATGDTDGGDALLEVGGLPFAAFHAHHESRGASGPVSVDDVTLTTARPLWRPCCDDDHDNDDGDAESFYAPSVSTMSMSSMFTRHRDWEHQRTDFKQVLGAGDLRCEDPSYWTERTALDETATVDVDPRRKRMGGKKKKYNPLEDCRVLIIVLIAVGVIVGLATALIVKGTHRNAARVAITKTSVAADIDSEEGNCIMTTVNFDPFIMNFVMSSLDDKLDAEILRDVTFDYMYHGFAESYDKFKGMGLDVYVHTVVEDNSDLNRRQLRRLLKARMFRAEFGGYVKFLGEDPGDPLPTTEDIQRRIEVLFSSSELETWVNFAYEEGLRIASVVVSDSAGSDIGSTGDLTAAAPIVAKVDEEEEEGEGVKTITWWTTASP